MSSEILLAIIVLLVMSILGLGFLAWRQHRAITKLQQPQYGFLGKPLPAVAAMVLAVSVFGVNTIFNFGAVPTNEFVSGDTQIGIELSYAKVDENTVNFQSQLLLNNEPWDAPTFDYEIAWSIIDSDDRINLYLQRVTEQTGKVTYEVDLKPGKYLVYADLNYAGRAYTQKLIVEL